MSLEKMIALHPHSDHRFDPLALAARHAGLAALFCTSCADACLAEDFSTAHRDLRQCIRMCLDTADICTAASRIATRLTAYDATLRRRMLELCIEACTLCAEECDRHDHEHCKLCATMCRECADDCRRALESL
ncbi:MAG TPA: four-helix bundle copper-binding protein [Sphingomonadaceae bacterium]|jgi:hypothetical protein|nr:four-helix bundle copper-binding protein [Sphingomonadaceae bacterium]